MTATPSSVVLLSELKQNIPIGAHSTDITPSSRLQDCLQKMLSLTEAALDEDPCELSAWIQCITLSISHVDQVPAISTVLSPYISTATWSSVAPAVAVSRHLSKHCESDLVAEWRASQTAPVEVQQFLAARVQYFITRFLWFAVLLGDAAHRSYGPACEVPRSTCALLRPPFSSSFAIAVATGDEGISAAWLTYLESCLQLLIACLSSPRTRRTLHFAFLRWHTLGAVRTCLAIGPFCLSVTQLAVEFERLMCLADFIPFPQSYCDVQTSALSGASVTQSPGESSFTAGLSLLYSEKNASEQRLEHLQKEAYLRSRNALHRKRRRPSSEAGDVAVGDMSPTVAALLSIAVASSESIREQILGLVGTRGQSMETLIALVDCLNLFLVPVGISGMDFFCHGILKIIHTTVSDSVDDLCSIRNVAISAGTPWSIAAALLPYHVTALFVAQCIIALLPSPESMAHISSDYAAPWPRWLGRSSIPSSSSLFVAHASVHETPSTTTRTLQCLALHKAIINSTDDTVHHSNPKALYSHIISANPSLPSLSYAYAILRYPHIRVQFCDCCVSAPPLILLPTTSFLCLYEFLRAVFRSSGLDAVHDVQKHLADVSARIPRVNSASSCISTASVLRDILSSGNLHSNPARFALPVDSASFVIRRVEAPALGGAAPASVIATFTVVCPGETVSLWSEITARDVLLLISPPSISGNEPDTCCRLRGTVPFVRVAEVVEPPLALDSPDKTGTNLHRFVFRVALDPIAYRDDVLQSEHDAAEQLGGDELCMFNAAPLSGVPRPYTEICWVVSRERALNVNIPKLHAISSVAKSVDDKETGFIPSWLERAFLGQPKPLCLTGKTAVYFGDSLSALLPPEVAEGTVSTMMQSLFPGRHAIVASSPVYTRGVDVDLHAVRRVHAREVVAANQTSFVAYVAGFDDDPLSVPADVGLSHAIPLAVRYTAEQLAAIELLSGDAPGLRVVAGVTSSGKTTVLLQSILNLVSRKPSARVLVLAQSQASLDTIAAALMASRINPALCIRLGHAGKGDGTGIRKYALNPDAIVKLIESYKPVLLEKVRAISDLLGGTSIYGDVSASISAALLFFQYTVSHLDRAFVDQVRPIFDDLENLCAPIEMLPGPAERETFVLSRIASIILATTTHMALKRADYAATNLRVTHIMVEDAHCVQDIEVLVAASSSIGTVRSLSLVGHPSGSPPRISCPAASTVRSSLFHRMIRVTSDVIHLSYTIGVFHSINQPVLDALGKPLRCSPVTVPFAYPLQYVHIPDPVSEDDRFVLEATYVALLYKYLRIRDVAPEDICIVSREPSFYSLLSVCLQSILAEDATSVRSPYGRPTMAPHGPVASVPLVVYCASDVHDSVSMEDASIQRAMSCARSAFVLLGTAAALCRDRLERLFGTSDAVDDSGAARSNLGLSSQGGALTLKLGGLTKSKRPFQTVTSIEDLRKLCADSDMPVS